MARSFHFSGDLFPEQREELFFDIGVGRRQSFRAVDVSDDRLDTCRVAEGAQEFIGSQVSEPYSVHAAAFPEDKLAGVEGEDGIADPSGFTFYFERFISSHGGMMKSGNRACESFHPLTLNSFMLVPCEMPSIRIAVKSWSIAS